MYHCDDFKNCTQLQAKHYCAKKNHPDLVFDKTASSENVISMACDMTTQLCNSREGHVHNITHDLSRDSNHLKTTYTIFKDGVFEKNSVYSFTRKQ